MELATILILVLCTGGAALLIWFEASSRRNKASKKQSEVGSLKTEDPSKKEPEIEKTTAA